MTRGVVSEGERGEAGGGCRGDANNAGVHQPAIVHLDIYFSGVDVANGRIRVRGSGPLPRNGFTVDRSVYTHTTPPQQRWGQDIINNDSAQKIFGLR